jgi:hypothetical protein
MIELCLSNLKVSLNINGKFCNGNEELAHPSFGDVVIAGNGLSAP